jgi:elongation factor Ts
METSQVSFTPKDVMTLRQETGMPMMECKSALEATGGNMAAAKEWLRENSKTKMEKRTERATGEGRIGVAVGKGAAVIIEVRAETDFTARNDDFVKMVDDVAKASLKLPAGPVKPTADMSKRIDDVRLVTRENVNFARGEKLEGGSFGSYVHHDGKRGVILQVEGAAVPDDLMKGLCQHIVAYDPLGISEKDVPAAEVERIRKDALREAQESGKPADIAKKIAEGKVRKLLEEKTLLHQKYVLDESKAVKDVIPKGATIKRFVRYTLGGA